MKQYRLGLDHFHGEMVQVGSSKHLNEDTALSCTLKPTNVSIAARPSDHDDPLLHRDAEHR